MKHLARATLTLAVLALLAAIWAPGPWWSWLLTGVLLLFVGAALGGQAEMQDKPTGSSTGPHVHITPARVTDHDVDNYRREHGIPQYGRKADDQ